MEQHNLEHQDQVVIQILVQAQVDVANLYTKKKSLLYKYYHLFRLSINNLKKKKKKQQHCLFISFICLISTFIVSLSLSLNLNYYLNKEKLEKLFFNFFILFF
jgi:hypothetical protein